MTKLKKSISSEFDVHEVVGGWVVVGCNSKDIFIYKRYKRINSANRFKYKQRLLFKKLKKIEKIENRGGVRVPGSGKKIGRPSLSEEKVFSDTLKKKGTRFPAKHIKSFYLTNSTEKHLKKMMEYISMFQTESMFLESLVNKAYEKFLIINPLIK